MGHLDDLLDRQSALRRARSPSTGPASGPHGVPVTPPPRVRAADTSPIGAPGLPGAAEVRPAAGPMPPSTHVVSVIAEPEQPPDVAPGGATAGPGQAPEIVGRARRPPSSAPDPLPDHSASRFAGSRDRGRGPLAAAMAAYGCRASRATRPTPPSVGSLIPPRCADPLLPGWSPARRTGGPPAPATTVGQAALKGSEEQQYVARRIKGDAVPRILAVLGLLVSELREEEGLADHGRAVVMETLDGLDAGWWIAWHAGRDGESVGPLVGELWWRCRDEARYRAALREARAWRGGLADLALPAVAQASLAEAQSVGYAVIGPGAASLRWDYERWCRERGLPRVVADLTGRYPWDSGVVTSATHALVSASPGGRPRYFLGEERAAMEASCAACVPPDDPTARVSADSRGVSAIVPRALAVPLAARLYALVTRPEPREDPRPESRPVEEPPIGLQQSPCPSPPSDIRNPKDIQTMNGERNSKDIQTMNVENNSKDTSNMSIENSSKDIQTMNVENNSKDIEIMKSENNSKDVRNMSIKRKPPSSARPRPAAATPPPVDDGTDAPPLNGQDQGGETARKIVRKPPSCARARPDGSPRAGSGTVPAVLDPARRGRPDAVRQIADAREPAGRRPPEETPAAEPKPEPEPKGSDFASIEERIAWYLEAEDADEFSKRVLFELDASLLRLTEDIPALVKVGRVGVRDWFVLLRNLEFLKFESIDHELEEELQKAHDAFEPGLFDELFEAELG